MNEQYAISSTSQGQHPLPGETALPFCPSSAISGGRLDGRWPVSPWKGLPSCLEDKIGRHCSGTISSEVWGLGLLRRGLYWPELREALPPSPAPQGILHLKMLGLRSSHSRSGLELVSDKEAGSKSQICCNPHGLRHPKLLSSTLSQTLLQVHVH